MVAHDDTPCCPPLPPCTLQVVAQAGLPAAVTIATNMAGRGTDIILGGNPEGLTRMGIKRYILRWGPAARSWVELSVLVGAFPIFEWRWQHQCMFNQFRQMVCMMGPATEAQWALMHP